MDIAVIGVSIAILLCGWIRTSFRWWHRDWLRALPRHGLRWWQGW